jgi:hypothetical protein
MNKFIALSFVGSVRDRTRQDNGTMEIFAEYSACVQYTVADKKMETYSIESENLMPFIWINVIKI